MRTPRWAHNPEWGLNPAGWLHPTRAPRAASYDDPLTAGVNDVGASMSIQNRSPKGNASDQLFSSQLPLPRRFPKQG